MNKILFIFSNLVAVIGICILFTTSMLNQVIPKLGFLVVQSKAAGSYYSGDYTMNFTTINLFAISVIIIGVVVGAIVYKKGLAT